MVKYSDEELIEELRKCEKEHGEVTSSILNDSGNDYPTQPTYQYRFGSFSNAMEKAGLQANPRGRGKYSKKDIRELTKEYFDEHGNIYSKDFASDDALPSNSAMYKHYDGIDALLKDIGIYEDVMDARREKLQNQENRTYTEKYTEEDREYLLSHLHYVNSKFDKVTTQTLQQADGPSKTIYDKIFGSIYEARAEAGITKKYTENFRDRIGELPDTYDEDADAYVYVLLLHSDDGERFYYIGQSRKIEKRLNAHTSGKSEIRHRKEHVYDKISNLPLEVNSLVKIENIYKNEEETDKEFSNRVSDIEHVTSYKIASGLETSNILGGR